MKVGVLFVDQGAITLDAAAFTDHAFDEVAVELACLSSKEGSTAFINAVTDDRFELKVFHIEFIDGFFYGAGYSAGLGETSAVGGGILKLHFGHGSYVDIAAVKKGHEFKEGQDSVDIGLSTIGLALVFFCDAGAYEIYL